VPKRYRDSVSGYRLGSWTQNQRIEKDTMSPDRRQRLEALDFVWDPLTDSWEEGFRLLQLFHQREGHCRVPQRYRDSASGLQLGQWASNQRQAQETVTPERRQRLDTLGFVWDVLAAQWEEGFRLLQFFHQREGHCRIPRNHREQGFRLGNWVSHQRKDKDTMSPECRQRLDALGFVWKVLSSQWEEGFSALQMFHQREGHCLVPMRYREQSFPLGQWVGVQRRSRETMSPERRQRLEALGFVWDTLTAAWGKGFRSLQLFHQREGHCRVPQGHREQGFRLGVWVSEQRLAKATMSPERRQRLEPLGFVWNAFAAQWEDSFRSLENYRKENGDCLVPVSYRDPASGYRLGLWVGNQRRDKDTMSPDHRQRLDAFGFVWKVR
jgi:Fe2+ transport system protein FeoA/DNA-binding TFAR19-related protein (PDSD5 family)